jgi:hypothetical protein
MQSSLTNEQLLPLPIAPREPFVTGLQHATTPVTTVGQIVFHDNSGSLNDFLDEGAVARALKRAQAASKESTDTQGPLLRSALSTVVKSIGSERVDAMLASVGRLHPTQAFESVQTLLEVGMLEEAWVGLTYLAWKLDRPEPAPEQDAEPEPDPLAAMAIEAAGAGDYKPSHTQGELF